MIFEPIKERVLHIDPLPDDIKTTLELLINLKGVDGRVLGTIAAGLLTKAYINLDYNDDEGGFYDVSSEELLYEVRILTKYGVRFIPSYMIGQGRKYDEEKYIDKLNRIKGFIIIDSLKFPEIQYRFIESSDVANGLTPRTKPTRQLSLRQVRKLGIL